MDSASWGSSESDWSPPTDFAGDAQILLSNLIALGEEASVLDRRRLAQLGELAALVTLPEHTGVRDALRDFTGDLPDRRDVIRFCRALTEHGYRYRDEVFGHGEHPSASASECVAYLQNRYADTAYLALTSHLSKPRASYFSSFSDVCEEVYHGLCEFCILPVESAEDGKLIRFYALIEKFDLKIVAVCDVESANGSYTRYALLRHKYVSLAPNPRLCGEAFAEFDLVTDAEVSLGDVLSAAEFCGLRLSRADSAPLPYRADGYRYGLVFSLGEPSNTDGPEETSEAAKRRTRDLEGFLLYLSVALPEFTPLGVYTRLSE